MSYNFLFLSAFILSLIITGLITPSIIKIAKHYDFTDKPSERKVHQKPIPLGGGIAVYVGFFITILIISFFIFFITSKQFFSYNAVKTIKYLTGLIICGTIALIMGLVDDKKVLPAKLKFMIQIAIALILYYFGFSIDYITLPGAKIFYLSKTISLILTLLWIVGLTNALNFLDGLDGLLAGITVISSVALAIITASQGQLIVTVFMIILAGSCLGFLRYNFYPAKIFLGDAGSLFIGIMFSSLSIIGAFKVTATLVFVIPVIIMGIPIFDTTYAVTRRMVSGQPVFKADKEHLHHKLLNMGLSQKKVVLTIYAINALLCAFSLYLYFK